MVTGAGEDAPAGPQPAPAREETGDPRVDEVLGRLDELGGLPVTEHPALFEQVHDRLAEVLGEAGTRDPGSHGR